MVTENGEAGSAVGDAAYAFQFHKKMDAPGFIAALENSCLVNPVNDVIVTAQGRKMSYTR